RDMSLDSDHSKDQTRGRRRGNQRHVCRENRERETSLEREISLKRTPLDKDVPGGDTNSDPRLPFKRRLQRKVPMETFREIVQRQRRESKIWSEKKRSSSKNQRKLRS